jgi:hypothetical protein
MNNAQIRGMRNIWDGIKDTASEKKTMTAVEMAMTKHNLSKDGELAFCQDATYMWNEKFGHWVLYKTL